MGGDAGLHFLATMADQIGLTIDQEEEINSLINQAKLDSAVDRERMSQIRESLHQLAMADDGFDSASASELADELSGIVARRARSSAELRYTIRQVLTPEQREALEAFRGGGRRQPPFIFHETDPLTE